MCTTPGKIWYPMDISISVIMQFILRLNLVLMVSYDAMPPLMAINGFFNIKDIKGPPLNLNCLFFQI